eukprot:1689483-Amphidinium_carterae.2
MEGDCRDVQAQTGWGEVTTSKCNLTRTVNCHGISVTLFSRQLTGARKACSGAVCSSSSTVAATWLCSLENGQEYNCIKPRDLTEQQILHLKGRFTCLNFNKTPATPTHPHLHVQGRGPES